jgi:hypothetical protein
VMSPAIARLVGTPRHQLSVDASPSWRMRSFQESSDRVGDSSSVLTWVSRFGTAVDGTSSGIFWPGASKSLGIFPRVGRMGTSAFQGADLASTFNVGQLRHPCQERFHYATSELITSSWTLTSCAPSRSAASWQLTQNAACGMTCRRFKLIVSSHRRQRP